MFLGERAWFAVHIAGAMLNKIKFIAAYQTQPGSAVTHWAPQARSGDGGDDNLVTTSMARNAAKGSLDLADLGWTLRPAGRLAEWDGLARRYLASVRAHPALAARSPSQGFTAALKAALPAAYSA